MLRFWAEPEFESLFRREGLVGFDAWYSSDRGKVIDRNSHRDVAILHLDDEGRERTFFLKRFHKPHFKDMWFAFHNCLKLTSQAEFERSNADLLRKLGVGSFRPVVVGASFACGLIERCSVLVTEKLESVQLPDYVNEHWATMSDEKKKAFLEAMGKTARRVHNKPVNFPDLYSWHYFVREQGEGFDFDLIDLHRMQRRMVFPHCFSENLGALLFSMPDAIFSPDNISSLLDGYFAGDKPEKRAAMLPKIQKRADKLRTRKANSVKSEWKL